MVVAPRFLLALLALAACLYSAILAKAPRESSLESNPFQAEAWIQLGLQAELNQHDPVRAERYYLEAARVNHMYLPQWTLTNFYLRQQDKRKFFETAKRALELTPYDSRPILAQAWTMASQPGEVFAILPPRERVRFEFLSFVLANGLSDQFQAAALSAAAFRFDTPVENPGIENSWRDILGSTEDRLIATGRSEPPSASGIACTGAVGFEFPRRPSRSRSRTVRFAKQYLVMASTGRFSPFMASTPSNS
jgi:tetratricopeptide (TPR) repeat protein